MSIPDGIECSMALVDISGFTEMLYHASRSKTLMSTMLKGIERLFSGAAAAAAIQNVQIINTTGDGFLAIAQGPTPSRTAVAFAQAVQDKYDERVKAIFHGVPFRHRVELRIALHHGIIYKMALPRLGEQQTIFVGDDINLLARTVNSHVARRYGMATTRVFYRRLMLLKARALPVPDEVILDRSWYPEQVDVFRMPASIPTLRHREERNFSR